MYNIKTLPKYQNRSNQNVIGRTVLLSYTVLSRNLTSPQLVE